MGAAPVILTFRPIKTWPPDWNRERLDRVDSPFKASYADTLELLDRELQQLGATNVVLQVDASDRDCRLDGQLRADAKVRHPGVILTFDTAQHGTLTYACEQFGAVSYRAKGVAAWQHNLRAIALGLEALRKVERYGIANRGQQYAGYRELGSGIAMGPAMTVEQAIDLLRTTARWQGPFDPLTDRAQLEGAYRQAARLTHPDLGGDADTFRRLTEARRLLLEQP